MFELHPFVDCPMCGAAAAYGVLHIGGNHMTQRCKHCRFSENTPLPKLDKKVIYLDQFAISNVYRIQAGDILPQPHDHRFWVEFERRITRALTSQAVVFPASDIHRAETIVSPFPSQLRIAHEMFGGDVSFKKANSLLFSHEIAYARAFINDHPAPKIVFNVDDAIVGDRSSWLTNMHITVSSDYSSFANGLRESRKRLDDAMRPLYEAWKTEKPSFKIALKKELAGYGPALAEMAWQTRSDYADATVKEDFDRQINISMSHDVRRMMSMIREFRNLGVPEEECFVTLLRFWRWPELQRLPYHWISAHLFAVTAHRLASGQKRLPEPSFSNDIKAIATYAPYADAMFIDKECENLLNDVKLKKALSYKARVFSVKSVSQFFDYLDSLEDALPDDVKRWTSFLYNLSPRRV